MSHCEHGVNHSRSIKAHNSAKQGNSIGTCNIRILLRINEGRNSGHVSIRCALGFRTHTHGSIYAIIEEDGNEPKTMSRKNKGLRRGTGGGDEKD